MYLGLRPEIRGAQRILRSAIPLKRYVPVPQVSRVRSFSSHLRLLNNSDHTEGHDHNGSRRSPGIDAFTKAENTAKERKLEELTNPEQRSKWLAREDAIKRGEIPAGHSIAVTPADLPEELGGLEHNSSTFPAFYVSEPGYEGISPLRHIPQEFPGFDNLNNGDVEAWKSAKVDGKPHANPEDLEHNSRHDTAQDRQSASTHTGAARTSNATRRRRLRRSKSFLEEAETEAEDTIVLPTWFVDHNIQVAPMAKQSQSMVQDQPQKEGVQAVQDSNNAEESAALPETPVQVEASGGPDTPNDGIPSSIAETRRELMLPLADGRYYVHQHQYAEVLTVLKGSLQRSSDADQSQDINAMRHLALFHTAKDADLLLDDMVKRLCSDVDATYVKIDVQDVAEFVLATDPRPEVLVGINKLSYGIYNNIYGRQDSEVLEDQANEEDEEDEEQDEEDDGPPHIDFSAVVALPMASLGQGGQRGLADSLADVVSRFTKPPRETRHDGHVQALAKIVDNYANAIIDKAIEATDKHAASGQKADQTPKSHPRPVIIQLSTYGELNDYAALRDFRHSLIVAADKRSAEGQPVVVVGTDALRDLSFLYGRQGRFLDLTSPIHPQKLLEEQGIKCGSATTAVMLTPCLPDKQAEAALVQDRKSRIRDINVRHLYQAVKRKGIALKGLEDGFWAAEYTAQLGERDCKVLTQHLMRYLEVERLSSVIAGLELSQTPVTDAVETIKRSDESKVAWARQLSPSTSDATQDSATPSKQQSRSNTLSRARSGANKYEQKLMSGVIEPRKINTTFDDIHIPADTVDALQTLTSLSLEYPEAFKYGVLKSDRIPGLMLYGPPGTGKTLAAKAVAKESGATMLEVSAADLYDMYVGEGEKNIRALFSLARKLSPCVVFIDEADALFSKRQDRGSKSNHRELLNQFLKEWDGMSNDSGSAFIMVATNRPMDMDDAVLRRLPRRLLVDLPTEADRQEILKIHLRNETLAEEVDLADLAKKTPFYSGSDLKNLAVAAALQVVREQHAAAKTWQKQNPNSLEKYQYPTTRTITQAHFDKALLEISASISEDMSSLKEIKKFDEQYGDRKGKKKKSSKWGFKSAADADKVLDTIKVRS